MEQVRTRKPCAARGFLNSGADTVRGPVMDSSMLLGASRFYFQGERLAERRSAECFHVFTGYTQFEAFCRTRMNRPQRSHCGTLVKRAAGTAWRVETGCLQPWHTPSTTMVTGSGNCRLTRSYVAKISFGN